MTKLKNKVTRTFLVALTAVTLTTATAPAAMPVQAKTSYVYITKSGKKYHSTKNCRSLKRSKKITKIKLSTAKSRGYKPCKICN